MEKIENVLCAVRHDNQGSTARRVRQYSKWAENGHDTKADPWLLEPLVTQQAATTRAWIKRTNMQPMQTARFDDAIIMGRGKADAGWILSGGFLN